MARYEQRFKERTVAGLLLPESVAPEVLAREVDIDTGTLLRWREEIESRVRPARTWKVQAWLDAVIPSHNTRSLVGASTTAQLPV